jgi:hypothetical protein
METSRLLYQIFPRSEVEMVSIGNDNLAPELAKILCR